MRTRLLAPLALAGLALGAPALQAQALVAPPRQVEDVLPATSYVSVQFAGLSAFSDAAEQVKVTALGRDILERIGDEVYQRYIGGQLSRYTTMMRRQLERVGMEPAALYGVLQRPMALGVGRLTLEGMGSSIALVIDAGGARQDIENVMAAVARLGTQHGLQSSEEELHGHRVEVHRGHGLPPVFAGYIGDYFVVTNSRGYFGDIADVVAGKQHGLAHASELGTARANLPEPALLSCYVNTSTLVSMFDDHLPYEAGQWARVLGVSGMSGVYVGLSGAGNGTAEVVHVGLTGSTSGLLKAAVRGPVSLEPARYCSPDTAAFAAFSLDVPALIDAFHQFLDILPEDVAAEIRREMHREMERELRHVGFDAESLHKLIQSFGSNAAVAVNLPNSAVPLPELLAFVEVEDYGHVSRYIEMLQGMMAKEAGIEWRTRQFGETEVHYCSVRIPDSPLGLSPCFAWHDGYLVISTHVRNLRAALKQAEEVESSLLNEPDFQRLAADSGNASGLMHLRYLRGVELTWRAVETWVEPMLEAERHRLGFGSEILPDGDALSEALGTATYSFHVDDSGVMLRERADVGFGTVLVVLGAVADHVLGKASAKVY